MMIRWIFLEAELSNVQKKKSGLLLLLFFFFIYEAYLYGTVEEFVYYISTEVNMHLHYRGLLM